MPDADAERAASPFTSPPNILIIRLIFGYRGGSDGDQRTALEAATRWGLPFKEPAAEPTGRDRREAERVMAYWDEKLEELGDEATIAALDLAAINNAGLVQPLPDRGRREGRAIGALDVRPAIRAAARPAGEAADRSADDAPVAAALCPTCFCAAAPRRRSRWARCGWKARSSATDERIEQYRAVFIPVKVRPNSLTRFAFGAFNSRVVEPALAA